MTKGKHHTKEAIEKIRQAAILQKRKKMSKETKKKIGMANKGKVRPNWLRKQWSILKKGIRPKNISGLIMGKKGKDNIFWKGGITPVNAKIRTSLEYKLWRKSVFERDHYTCIWCKRSGVRIEADHIKPFSMYPALRFAIDNGRTLCKECHRKTETFGRKSLA